jgi:hypothetical protein
MVSLSDIEVATIVEDLGPSDEFDDKVTLIGAQLKDAVEKQGHSRIREHVRILFRSFGGGSRFRQHEVQQTSNMPYGVVNCDSDAGTKSIRNQNSIGIIAYHAVGDSHNVGGTHDLPRFEETERYPLSGLRYVAGLTYSSE